jgi:NADH-quinone oxidoreductase subunit B
MEERRARLGAEEEMTTPGQDVIVTRLDAAIDWTRKNSVWPMPLGLACCGIELMAVGASRFDIARFGAEVMRFSPRQCDLMIVAGTCVYKMAGAVKRLWDQMAHPKWCMAMGACASTGGMYRSYAVVQGVDRFLPVDVYVSGCPPRPEAVLEGLIALQRKIAQEKALQSMKTGDRSGASWEKVTGPVIIRGEYANARR